MPSASRNLQVTVGLWVEGGASICVPPMRHARADIQCSVADRVMYRKRGREEPRLAPWPSGNGTAVRPVGWGSSGGHRRRTAAQSLEQLEVDVLLHGAAVEGEPAGRLLVAAGAGVDGRAIAAEQLPGQ